ncbi:AraC family transcriptional regulator [Tepidamorphus gemmatus]|jgi:AraC-like DNA-binding protein|uniref:AraC family transcriptional regulator n=1 Tax=Tepidamorphus gemmatus TaxID=747076 RepID=A0A4R3MD04_9HYPH|nr:AraC family transcriptional regulator [Tepidamorphus gemmatus]TCT09917.1 AraC family transcriptional regulator [Tepidamorphus gemmatus]
MSSAFAVFHGAFGRVCLYAMDRQMAPHAHREGHLIFHVDGPAATVMADDRYYPLSAGQAVAISPWQTHYYRPLDLQNPTLVLVLYIRPGWFLEASRRASSSLRFGRVGIEVTDPLARNVYATAHAMMDPEHEDPLLEERIWSLTQGAFDQSWQWTARGLGFTGPALPARDFRIRKAIRLLQDRLGEPLQLDMVAREAGLSRPHFYKLFRSQVGVTPNVYLNALRMEQAIDRLTASHEAVSDIGLDLGFSSQASFSRFFIANGVVAPSAYRRSVQQLQLH